MVLGWPGGSVVYMAWNKVDGWNRWTSCFLRSLGHAPWSIQRLRVSRTGRPDLTSLTTSIVEFATEEDAKRAKVELADKQLLGRPVFIREVSHLDSRQGRY
jgi:hypothetical protein